MTNFLYSSRRLRSSLGLYDYGTTYNVENSTRTSQSSGDLQMDSTSGVKELATQCQHRTSEATVELFFERRRQNGCRPQREVGCFFVSHIVRTLLHLGLAQEVVDVEQVGDAFVYIQREEVVFHPDGLERLELVVGVQEQVTLNVRRNLVRVQHGTLQWRTRLCNKKTTSNYKPEKHLVKSIF